VCESMTRMVTGKVGVSAAWSVDVSEAVTG
jgi:hypothetical protein